MNDAMDVVRMLLDWHDGPGGGDINDVVMRARAVMKAIEQEAPLAPPTPRKWLVEGTVHMAGGFSLPIEAIDEVAARDAVRDWLEDRTSFELVERCGVDLQEVCVNSVEPLTEDAP